MGEDQSEVPKQSSSASPKFLKQGKTETLHSQDLPKLWQQCQWVEGIKRTVGKTKAIQQHLVLYYTLILDQSSV